MNFRPASAPLIAALKRRLEKSRPPASLALDSVKVLSIPGDHREITTFICQTPNPDQRLFVAEFAEGNASAAPQLYCALPLPAAEDAKEVLRVMLSAIRAVAVGLRERDIKAQPIILRPLLRLITPTPPLKLNGFAP